MRAALALGMLICSQPGVGITAEAGKSQRPGWVDENRLLSANQHPENWYTPRRALAGDHFSPLTEINEANVATVGFAWEYGTGTRRGLEASPVVVDGVMFTSGNWGRVYAMDAAKGTPLWEFDPKVPGAWGRRACCDIVNRGVAVWKGRVYVSSLDGRLFALDARDGRVLWSKDTLVDRSRFQTSTGAPQIAGDRVIIGNAGAELGVRGYITAYDTESGDLAWRFFTVPGDPKQPYEHSELKAAAATWDPQSRWDVGGGGTVWDAMAYDPKLNLLYVGVGNGSPHPAYSRSPAGGDNLYLASILAIDPRTGRLRWHYQTTPGESWDYTATQQMVLADLQIAGRTRSVLMQAPKNGFFYVLDRATGELLSTGKYGLVNWATHIDSKTGRPHLTGIGDYSAEPKLVYPGEAGAHNWRPMSFSPQTGLVYIPTIQWPMLYSYHPDPRFNPAGWNMQAHVDVMPVPPSQLGVIPETTSLDYLQAYDPIAQKMVWRVNTSGVPEHSGGVLSTAGKLVIQGDSTGFLNVYSAVTGTPLVRINVGTSIMAAPISYAVDGTQYIAVMAGLGGAAGWNYPISSAAYRYGNDGRIVAFKLGGGAVPLRSVVDRSVVATAPPAMKTTPEGVARGRGLFLSVGCVACHQPGKVGNAPNLLAMSPEIHALFDDIVLKGLLEVNGMASFADVLKLEDARAIHEFLVDAARTALGGQPDDASHVRTERN